MIKMKNWLDTNENSVEIANATINKLIQDNEGGNDTTCLSDCKAKQLFPILAELGFIEKTSDDQENNVQTYKVLSPSPLRQMQDRMAREYVKEEE